MAWKDKVGMQYVAAVYGHWRGLALGLVPLLVPIILSFVRVSGESVTVPWWGWLAAFVIGLCLAQFLAWKSMRQERDTARQGTADLEASLSDRCLTILPELDCTVAPNAGLYGVRLGIRIHNFRDFVVRYKMIALAATVDGRTNPDTQLGTKWGEIPPEGTQSYAYAWILGVDLARQEPVPGTLDVTIQYGHPDYPPTRQASKEFRFHLVRSLGPTAAPYNDRLDAHTVDEGDERIPQDRRQW